MENVIRKIRSNLRGHSATLVRRLVNLTGWIKRVVAFTIDQIANLIACYLAFLVRLGGDSFTLEVLSFSFFASSVLFGLIAIFSGIYRVVLRYPDLSLLGTLAKTVTIFSGIYIGVLLFVGFEGVPRSIAVIQPLFLYFFILIWRMMAERLLVWSRAALNETNKRVGILGVNDKAVQLADFLNLSSTARVEVFISDEESNYRRRLRGQPVIAYPSVEPFLEDRSISTIYSTVDTVQTGIFAEKTSHIPNLNIISGFSVDDIVNRKQIYIPSDQLDLDEVLGRKPIEFDRELCRVPVEQRTVLVTGAGGSIGSEICRQLLTLYPKILILVDSSEFALYKIHEELKLLQSLSKETKNSTKIVPILCSVQNREKVRKIFCLWNPEIIFHVAAYKHVDLVERNICEGVKNNVFGTLNVFEAAVECRVTNCVLVSSDKAVRPTNIMGASKRLAEMIVQSLQDVQASANIFSIVRFGNVLASSGSVIPKFVYQVDNGGPVTVTDPEVNRFFMTVQEASQLVLKASGVAVGGEVFVLDMGEPVKILDLAKRIIEMKGFMVADSVDDEGIQIIFTGLGPGEKLYEELIIDGEVSATKIEKLFCINEKFVKWPELLPQLEELADAIEQNDPINVKVILANLVAEFKPDSRVVDWSLLED